MHKDDMAGSYEALADAIRAAIESARANGDYATVMDLTAILRKVPTHKSNPEFKTKADSRTEDCI